MKKLVRFQYNAPTTLTFALLSLGALVLNELTDGWTNTYLFSVWNSSLMDVLTYPRFFLHVLGHTDYSHYIENIMIILVLGPSLEERYGSRKILISIVITALITGLVHWFFFPHTMLLGASGVVFMMIVMASLAGMKNGYIPITLIVVLALYLGQEIVDAFKLEDNIYQLTHIIGGAVGAFMGLKK